nr:reverse transcriptase domain-containing protein [Tanacetum cinerariifolium]
MSEADIKRLIAQGVADALAEYESHTNSNLNGDGSHNSGSENGRLIVGPDAAYGMLWKTLMKIMTHKKIDEVEKYFGGLPDMIQARAYSAGPSEKKEYAGTLPLCNKCKFHHNGPCMISHPGNGEARGKVYALGGGETDQDPNNMNDDINA